MIAWLHRLLVHLPIGLLVTATLIRAHARWRRRPGPETTMMLAIGAAGAWLACVTGLAHAYEELRQGEWAESSMQVLALSHLSCSVSAALLFSAVMLLARRRDSGPEPRILPYLEALGLLLLLVTAHLGGLLAHG